MLRKIIVGAVATVAGIFLFKQFGASLPKLPGARN